MLGVGEVIAISLAVNNGLGRTAPFRDPLLASDVERVSKQHFSEEHEHLIDQHVIRAGHIRFIHTLYLYPHVRQIGSPDLHHPSGRQQGVFANPVELYGVRDTLGRGGRLCICFPMWSVSTLE